MTTKRCIFHLPMQIRENLKSASQIRPKLMLQGFRDAGYEVDVVAGSSDNRARLIQEIKKKISDGVEYDFLYSESSTMPTELTDEDHLPRHIGLDMSFFRYCRSHDIPVCLFYRDIYWKFPAYSGGSPLKTFAAKHFYRRDLKGYRESLDVLFVPSPKNELRYIQDDIGGLRLEALPPACELSKEVIARCEEHISRLPMSNDGLTIFYVGGIGSHYGMHCLMDAVLAAENINLELCVRKKDLEVACEEYKSLLQCDRVHVHHASGEELEKYYGISDIANLVFDPYIYIEMAVPFKLYEYAAHAMPMFANVGTAYADIVDKNDIGWIVNGAEDYRSKLAWLMQNPEELRACSRRCIEFAKINTWSDRAIQAANKITG